MKINRTLSAGFFVLLGALALLLFLWGAVAFGQGKPACDKTCQARFRAEWRPRAASRLAEHIGHHRDCDLADSLPIVEKIQFAQNTYKAGVRDLIVDHLSSHLSCESAQILRVLDAVEILPTSHVNPLLSGWTIEGKIFINNNPKHKWTDRKITLFLIHELIHICGHCLNDSVRSYDKAKPICTFLGRRIYHSMDLTEVIKDHFKEGKHGSND